MNKIPTGRWGGRSKQNNSDSEDCSDSNHRQKKKSSLSFLQKSKSQDAGTFHNSSPLGRPPRIKSMLRKKSHSMDATNDAESVDGEEFFTKEKKLRFGTRKRHNSADDLYSVDSSNNSDSNKGKTSLFARTKKAIGRNVSFGSADSDGSGDDGSVREKQVPRGLLKKKIGFRRKASNDSSDEEGSTAERPTRPKGVAFSDNSTRDSVNDDSEYGYDSSGVPTRRTEKKPSRERARYSVYHGQGTRAVKRKFRVRPYRAFTEAVHMTEEEIYADSLQPSNNAEFLKSYLIPSDRKTKNMDIPDQIRSRWGTPNDDGRIGSIRIEILGCVSLNRSKPDVCTYIVCGDSAFCTDIIQGYRSPMWPSPCKRAAVIPIHHAFAKVYLGVFDVRKRTNKDNDVFCGRVAINIANIRPDTEYDTTMPLRASSFVYDKRKRGVIRVRFSVHWFSDRAAVVSYFKDVQTIDDKNPLVNGNPTIPCADPRTFRNVAYTVHGQDLPGKYSRVAFRATLRELNLYQVNIQRMFLVCVLDVMFYENKLVSFYMFLSAMYCVYFNSVAMIPAVCTGYILIQYLNNYRHYVHKSDFNFGYKPLTVTELARSIIQNGRNHGTDPSKICMHPIEVDKWTKRRANVDNKFKNLTANGEDEPIKLDEGKDIRPLDHREFPFSEREAYPNFGVEDALAPGTTKGGTGRLHGRLSVYYAAPEAGDAPAAGNGNEEEESDLDSDRDDETVMTESQMMGDDGFDMDSASDEDDEANLEGADYNYKKVALAQKQQKGKTRLVQRVRLGPPQDSDVKGKKVPPQVTLKKMENLMYKFSKNVSVEFVHSGPQTENDGDLCLDTGMTPPSKELRTKMAQKAKKAQADEYDKILGLTVSYTNPIQRIMSSFMGPVMRMMRVAVFIMRIAYNLSAWRDPILSFWLLVILVTLFLILIVFPWRSFFFLTSIATMGPQNLFLRKILEKKAREMEEKKKNEQVEASAGSDGSDSDGSNNSRSKKKGKQSFLTKALTKSDKAKKAALKELYNNLDPKSRTAFCTTGQTTNSKKMPTRAVVVPYSRFKKDRFYDWPPDPTVSRATPVPLFESIHEDDSMTLSIPQVPIDEYQEGQTGLRQRKPNKDEPIGDFVPPPDIAF